jgi:kumamolisin
MGGQGVWLRRVPLGIALVSLLVTMLVVGSAGAPTRQVFAQGGAPSLKSGPTHRVPLPGAVPRAVAHAPRVGHEQADRQLQLSISLGLADPNGLAALIAGQQDPKSPQYHRYLTPQAFTDRFGPSSASVTAVWDFLRTSGIRVTSISANRRLIDATATVAQVERTFGVSIDQFQLGKRTVFAPAEPPLIPAELAPIILNIGGLDNLMQARPLRGSAQSSSHPVAHPLPGPAGGFTPTELRGAYDVATLISNGGTGNNQRVAVFELAPYIVNDISTYRSHYSLPASTINNISVDGASTTGDASGTGEADLDIEVVSALAPNATQDIYVGPNTDQGVNDTYNRIVTDDHDKVTTTSWGLCEPNSGVGELQTLDGIFAQAASQGQSIFAASGDTGSDDCFDRVNGLPSGLPPSVDSPAGDPYVLGAGGTHLTLSGGSYGSETVWNNVYGAGGGGVSSQFSKPVWQAGLGVTNSFSNGNREVPDVTADADPLTGYSVYCSSFSDCSGAGWVVFGGTSAAAPLWTGILTDVNSYLATLSISQAGWVNQTLYELFANQQAHTPYHDVTSGNNNIDYGVGSPYHGDYPSGTCYDLASGMGSPDAWNIAQDIASGVQTSGGGACPAPVTGTQLIQNGGFESGMANWTEYSADGQQAIYTSAQVHAGTKAFFPCGYAACDDRVSQTITIPATVNSATLRYWLSSFSPLGALPGAPCVDHVYATLATPDGTVLSGGLVQSACETDATSGYTLESFNVTSLLQAHTGQQLVIVIRGTTANEAGSPTIFTMWGVDDVSLLVS